MKKAIIIILLITLVVFAVGCSSAMQNPGQATSSMTKEDANKIADATKECIDAGGLKSSDGYYNENSKTWWFDIKNTKEGCNPACVVYEENGMAEVNWRCTGLKQ